MQPQGQEVYLDSNFIVAYFVEQHTSHIDALKLMAKLLIDKNVLCFSPLSLDEAFHKIYEALRSVAPPSPGGYNHAHFFRALENALNILLYHQQMKLRQFENDLQQGAINALDNISTFTLKPRDSFHIAYLQDLNINYIVSKDTAMDRLSSINITRIDF